MPSPAGFGSRADKQLVFRARRFAETFDLLVAALIAKDLHRIAVRLEAVCRRRSRLREALDYQEERQGIAAVKIVAEAAVFLGQGRKQEICRAEVVEILDGEFGTSVIIRCPSGDALGNDFIQPLDEGDVM
ncbi:hypothetical protein GCM10017056_21610 [Seohaeicola zhoushanensis]|uniref:Uncharacterized protein n=1 Tax=Seohaeicola zhoushanensis TaxID=1569283 RepID=A0A8J3GWN3_9RHOB|nr:hypothetical protein GCM10017056_21610 [Seohaeicola zhoushanensis]